MGAAWYLDFNSIKVQLELSNDSECYESKVDFNSIKVQLELNFVFSVLIHFFYFNSIKVQLELSVLGLFKSFVLISIP